MIVFSIYGQLEYPMIYNDATHTNIFKVFTTPGSDEIIAVLSCTELNLQFNRRSSVPENRVWGLQVVPLHILSVHKELTVVSHSQAH